ncbi:hypothetical protein BRC19_03100 [Candidatus Saccharibacteria bacterium QS_5_54_17]|nr:MAG: hypothetical protein BRC19_03100 [Candidatus Saccharibacteria bacterium QS_5_54_17]
MRRLRLLADMLKKPAYSGLCIAVAGAAGFVLIWFFNLELIVHVLSNTSLTPGQKAAFFPRSLLHVYATTFTSLRSFLFVVFTLLLGLNIMSFTYIKRRGEKGKRARWGSLPIALLGSGCAVCGGSILTPLLTLSGATVAAGASAFIHIGALVIAVALSGHGLWRVLGSHPQLVSDERW